MHRVTSVFESHRNRITGVAGTIATVALASTLLLTPVAQAQTASPEASPEASPVAESSTQLPAEITTLFSGSVAEFPESPVSVRLLKMTLQPGASSPMHTHPGPEFDFVVSGSLTVNSQGDATVTGSDGTEVTRSLSGDILTSGDLVQFPAGVGMNLVNNSDEELVLYSAVFHPINEELPSTTYVDGEPESGAFAGLTYQVLGDGLIQTFPVGEAVVTLDEILLPAGTDLPAQDGATLYSQVDGSFAFAVDSGNVQVSRTASPGLRPNAAPEQEFTLAQGDGAFFPSGVSSASRADQTGDLSLLRLSAVPAAADDGEAAAISFLESAAEVEDEPETFTEIAVGATVTTNTGSLNLRAEPSTAGDVVEQLDEGVELVVIGGPEEGDDYTWWQVQSTEEDASLEGWLAADFLDLVGGEAEPEATEEAAETPEVDGTPSADGTPQASPVADNAEFQTGDIVITTEENVRIREEATVNSEPIEVFQLGTEFEITGESVEEDELVWYPVTMVADDSMSGWIAADFIEPAPDDDDEE